LGSRLKGHMLWLFIVCMLLLCVQNVLGAFMYTMTHFIIYMSVLGVISGPLIASMYSCCSEVLQGQDVPILFTIYRSAAGVGQAIGIVIVGLLHDHTGSFQSVFFLNTGIYGATVLLCAFIIAVNAFRPRCMFTNHYANVTDVNPPAPAAA